MLTSRHCTRYNTAIAITAPCHAGRQARRPHPHWGRRQNAFAPRVTNRSFFCATLSQTKKTFAVSQRQLVRRATQHQSARRVVAPLHNNDIPVLYALKQRGVLCTVSKRYSQLPSARDSWARLHQVVATPSQTQPQHNYNCNHNQIQCSVSPYPRKVDERNIAQKNDDDDNDDDDDNERRQRTTTTNDDDDDDDDDDDNSLSSHRTVPNSAPE